MASKTFQKTDATAQVAAELATLADTMNHAELHAFTLRMAMKLMDRMTQREITEWAGQLHRATKRRAATEAEDGE